MCYVVPTTLNWDLFYLFKVFFTVWTVHSDGPIDFGYIRDDVMWVNSCSCYCSWWRNCFFVDIIVDVRSCGLWCRLIWRIRWLVYLGLLFNFRQLYVRYLCICLLKELWCKLVSLVISQSTLLLFRFSGSFNTFYHLRLRLFKLIATFSDPFFSLLEKFANYRHFLH